MRRHCQTTRKLRGKESSLLFQGCSRCSGFWELLLLLEEQAGSFSIRATKSAFQFHRSEHPPPLWLTDQTYRKSQGFFQPPQCSRQTLNCKAKGQFKAKLHRTWPILLDLVFPLGKAGRGLSWGHPRSETSPCAATCHLLVHLASFQGQFV